MHGSAHGEGHSPEPWDHAWKEEIRRLPYRSESRPEVSARYLLVVVDIATVAERLEDAAENSGRPGSAGGSPVGSGRRPCYVRQERRWSPSGKSSRDEVVCLAMPG